MNIRKANPADISSWAQLRNLLWPDSLAIHEKELADFFAGQSIAIEEVLVLVDSSDKVAGFIEINLRNFAEGSRNPVVPYIEGWYVAEQVRGRGYGKALMQAAENWAREKDFTELASDTEIDNTRSAAIHQKLGFEETCRVICLLKKLE